MRWLVRNKPLARALFVATPLMGPLPCKVCRNVPPACGRASEWLLLASDLSLFSCPGKSWSMQSCSSVVIHRMSTSTILWKTMRFSTTILQRKQRCGRPSLCSKHKWFPSGTTDLLPILFLSGQHLVGCFHVSPSISLLILQWYRCLLEINLTLDTSV